MKRQEKTKSMVRRICVALLLASLLLPLATKSIVQLSAVEVEQEMAGILFYSLGLLVISNLIPFGLLSLLAYLLMSKWRENGNVTHHPRMIGLAGAIIGVLGASCCFCWAFWADVLGPNPSSMIGLLFFILPIGAVSAGGWSYFAAWSLGKLFILCRKRDFKTDTGDLYLPAAVLALSVLVGISFFHRAISLKSQSQEASSPSTTADRLRKMSEQANYETLQHIAENPACPPDILTRLAQDQRSAIRQAVASNPNISPELLRELSADEAFAVRMYVLQHPNVPDDIIKEFLSDQDSAIQYKAKHLWKQREARNADVIPVQ